MGKFQHLKRLVAITLLSVYMFNLAGYPFLFRWLISDASDRLTIAIDGEKFPDSELVELKLKLNLPYLSSQHEYERFDGEITIDGRHHQYVKRKISRDTLYVLCVPNNEKDRLKKAEAGYSTTTNDFDQNKKTDNGSKKPALFNQFHQELAEYCLNPPLAPTDRPGSAFPRSYTNAFLAIQAKPPRLNS